MSLKKRFSHTPNSEVFSLSSLSSVRDVINSKPPSLELDIEVQETKGSDTDVTRETSQPCRYRWFRQLAKKCATKYPTPYARMQKVVLYLRGPSPAVDLPDPTPFLDIRSAFGSYSFSLPLESLVIRTTHCLANWWIFALCVVAYIIGLALLVRAHAFITPSESFVSCTATFWAAKDGCGLNGQFCQPFDNAQYDFRCPGKCNSVILQNPRTIGDEQIVFEPLIVGGGDSNRTYRSDSFVCAAAIQAGIVDRTSGGCGNIELVGNFTNFLPFDANGLRSIGFPTVFPHSFRLGKNSKLTQCRDLRDYALAFNAAVTVLLFVVLRPSPLALYWCLVCIGYWHISFFSQPRASPPSISQAFGTFLPTLYVAYAFWRLAFRFTMPAFRKAPIEATIWYGVPFWVGVLMNETMDKIPIDRLTVEDLQKRPGAIPALVIIVAILLVIVLNQVRVIRTTGWLPHYLGWYFMGGLVVLVLSLLPALRLRLHHYILAMAFMPGTAFPTRLSAIYQGFLLGMFLNGVAAFGFDSILQTAAELRRDAPIGSPLPSLLTNSSNWNASIPFAEQVVSWGALTDSWDGFALLVDDVQRYAGTALNFSLAAFDPSLPHFFRLAFTLHGRAGDFTMPATLWPNGTWVNALLGPS